MGDTPNRNPPACNSGLSTSRRIRTVAFLRFDILEGRGDQEIAALLDATPRVMVETFQRGERQWT